MPRCSLAASSGVFLRSIETWLYDVFLSQSALNPHMSFWWIFVEEREKCHTDPWFRQRHVRPGSDHRRWSPLESTSVLAIVCL